MTTTAPAAATVADEAAVRALLAQLERHRDASRLLIITAAPQWNGPEVLDAGFATARVVTGRSVLAVRAAMADHADDLLVVLTPLAIDELGQEVQARAWRQRAHRPSPWDTVRALFRVTDVDPSLRGDQWMVDVLARVAPARGYAQPPSGLLDRTTAWRTLYRYGLGLAVDEPTTADLLAWAVSPASSSAVARLDPATLRHLGEHLAVAAGPAAPALLSLVADGRGTDAVSLGLVADALWPSGDPVARALLVERHLGRRPLPDAAALDWGRTAREAVAARDADPDAPRRADELLSDIDPGDTADSAVLDRTFPRRLARLGAALAAVLEERNPALLRNAMNAQDGVREHLRASREAARVTRAEDALRLTRRVLNAAPADAAAGGLARLTADYVDDGAWVDAARHSVAEGETVAELAAVYRRLVTTVDAERAQRDRRFASALAAEAVTAPAAPPVLPTTRPLAIEHVLATVVAPVARVSPVLLLVVDGLSHAAAVPLLADLRREAWTAVAPEGGTLPPVVAALPTVTVVSRASLLCGRLTTGGQDVERDGFASNPALLEAAQGQAAVLFHKSDLRPVGGDIAPRVREAITDPTQRIVGVVVNAVDDHLDRGAQLRLADGLEGIPLLRPLLEAAAEARRAVVLTSDHGHILRAAQRVIAAPGGGERFRLDGDPPAADEIELVGPRVLRGDHRVIVGAEDTVRYVGVAKHGYHGGATPAEALCPLLVLVPPAVTMQGWEPVPPRAPAWWDPTQAPVEVEAVAPAAPPAAPLEPSSGQASLFDDSTPPAPADDPTWLLALLASPRLADQRRLAGRTALTDADLAGLLRVVAAGGGTVSGAALQRTLGLSPTRLRGKLEAARTLLDVEGYQVLRIELDNTAALNLDLLARQFEIDRSPRREGRP